MNEEKMYIPSGLKTRDGKDIMCYTGEFYLKNKKKIDKLVKKCEEILKADFENDNPSKSQENATNILKEDSEIYNLNTHLNMFEEQFLNLHVFLFHHISHYVYRL